MDTRSYTSALVRKEDVKKNWILVDAENQILGRLSSRIALVLRGKHKPSFTPHVDCGDYVVVINSAKIRTTGKKWDNRIHYTHSGYPGGQKLHTPGDLARKDPSRVIEWAVKRMLPKTRLGSQMYRNLHVYKDATHPHEAQQPKMIDLEKIR